MQPTLPVTLAVKLLKTTAEPLIYLVEVNLCSSIHHIPSPIASPISPPLSLCSSRTFAYCGQVIASVANRFCFGLPLVHLFSLTSLTVSSGCLPKNFCVL